MWRAPVAALRSLAREVPLRFVGRCRHDGQRAECSKSRETLMHPNAPGALRNDFLRSGICRGAGDLLPFRDLAASTINSDSLAADFDSYLARPASLADMQEAQREPLSAMPDGSCYFGVRSEGERRPYRAHSICHAA